MDYASSAAIIWQAAASAGTIPGQIASWMTALGLAMSVSTLALSGRCKAPVLTIWSTPGAALPVSDLQGVTFAGAVGVFIFADALIIPCGMTGLFARLMKIIPYSLTAAMLAGILLRFGSQAFVDLQEYLLLCDGMLAAWLLCKALWSCLAVVAVLVVGALIATAFGDVSRTAVPLAFTASEWIVPQFTPALLLNVGLPFFLVTMASQNASGFATSQASGCIVSVLVLLIACEGLTLLLAPLGVHSICIAAITTAIYQGPGTHPNPQRRWLTAITAGGFYLLAGLFDGSITVLMSALPMTWTQMLAGLALLDTIGGNLFQAVHQASGCDVAILTSLVTASDMTLAGIGLAFRGVVFGRVSCGALSVLRRPWLGRCQVGDRFHPMAEMTGGAKVTSQRNPC